jgi:hypothetical protein
MDERRGERPRIPRTLISSLVVAACCAAAPAPADAYIGPGAGISVIGTAVAFVGAVVFALVGFVWYPLKRLLALVRERRTQADGQEKASLP